MRAVIVLMLTLLICPFITVFVPSTGSSVPPPMPTPIFTPTFTPTAAVPAPHLEIRADSTTIRVGDTFTLTAVPVNIGIPIYTLKLSSGASAHVRYDDQEQTVVTNDPQFEVVSMHASMGEVTFTLRALAVGSADAIISATGEIREPSSGAFMWSGGTSPALTITVNP